MAETPQQWYYKTGKGPRGPISTGELKKLAASGMITPESRLRGVGMTEWIPASNLKGLFQSAAKQSAKPAQSPKPATKPQSNNDELGLAPGPDKKPQTPAPQSPKKSSTATAPQANQGPGMAAPISSPNMAPVADNNPFASFGTPSQATTAPNDPFAGVAGFDFGAAGGADPFANLVALEKQGAALPQQASASAASDPFAASQPAAKSSGGTGPLRRLAWRQRASLYSFSANLLFGMLCALMFMLFVASARPHPEIQGEVIANYSLLAFAGFLWLVCLLAALCYFVFIVMQMASLDYGVGKIILMLFLTYFIPFGIFIVLFLVNNETNARLQRAGYPTGFFGISPSRVRG